MTEPATPVVFVHGLWLHHTSWGPWQELFAAAGYAPVAPPWPGEHPTVEATRADPGPMAGYGVAELADHMADVVTALPRRPVVVGHSFGGLVAQILLARGLADAAVAINPAPIKGVVAVPLSALRVASLALRNPANRNRTVSLTLEDFRYGFANARTAQEAADLYDRWVIPAPGRPLFEAATANAIYHAPTTVDLRNSHRGPLLITLGGRDRAAPPAIAAATRRMHQAKSSAVTDLHAFPEAGHSLVVDPDWRQVADTALAWLRAQGR